MNEEVGGNVNIARSRGRTKKTWKSGKVVGERRKLESHGRQVENEENVKTKGNKRGTKKT